MAESKVVLIDVFGRSTKMAVKGLPKDFVDSIILPLLGSGRTYSYVRRIRMVLLQDGFQLVVPVKNVSVLLSLDYQFLARGTGADFLSGLPPKATGVYLNTLQAARYVLATLREYESDWERYYPWVASVPTKDGYQDTSYEVAPGLVLVDAVLD